jgi:hypothetical protein
MKRITAAALIASTVLFLVVNLIHPKEYTRNHEAEQLRTIADNYTRWQFAHFLTFIVILLFVFVVCGLAWTLFTRRPQLAVIGAALSLCGLVALGGVLALDGFTWAALGQVTTWPSADDHSLDMALLAVQQSKWNLPFYVGSLGWLVGIVILAVGLLRENLVPTWAGWTFAAGAVLTGVEGAVQNNAYFIVASAVLALGGTAVGLALLHDHSARIGDVQPG